MVFSSLKFRTSNLDGLVLDPGGGFKSLPLLERIKVHGEYAVARHNVYLALYSLHILFAKNFVFGI